MDHQLAEIRNMMLKSGYHAGDPHLLENVHWTLVGDQDLVVTGDSGTKPAVLSMIVNISTSEFHLTADGDWKGPVPGLEEIWKVHATCKAESPNEETHYEDFLASIANLSALQQTISQSAVMDMRCFMRQNEGTEEQTKLMFRHGLFKVSRPC